MQHRRLICFVIEQWWILTLVFELNCSLWRSWIRCWLCVVCDFVGWFLFAVDFIFEVTVPSYVLSGSACFCECGKVLNCNHDVIADASETAVSRVADNLKLLSSLQIKAIIICIWLHASILYDVAASNLSNDFSHPVWKAVYIKQYLWTLVSNRDKWRCVIV